jgi:hypothetical protein
MWVLFVACREYIVLYNMFFVYCFYHIVFRFGFFVVGRTYIMVAYVYRYWCTVNVWVLSVICREYIMYCMLYIYCLCYVVLIFCVCTCMLQWLACVDMNSYWAGSVVLVSNVCRDYEYSLWLVLLFSGGMRVCAVNLVYSSCKVSNMGLYLLVYVSYICRLSLVIL